MAAIKTKIELQYGDKSVSQDDLVARAKAAFEEKYNVKGVKSLELYVKPEDGKAYYVVNHEMTGDIDL
ncbi:DUF6465 family protein [Butyrivibrio sp. NC2002]|uniref:DUF6465 family protein n=1 Tax=Butyrivibrio sp. NC2002 TaxID=1410610 RepID=UPI00055ED04B|nr:DUF6465 family protein [Butyrivibrio sp. NC2002]